MNEEKKLVKQWYWLGSCLGSIERKKEIIIITKLGNKYRLVKET